MADVVTMKHQSSTLAKIVFDAHILHFAHLGTCYSNEFALAISGIIRDLTGRIYTEKRNA